MEFLSPPSLYFSLLSSTLLGMEARRTHNPEAVRRLRIEAGLNQKELAAKAAISEAHMSSIEHGRKNPSAPVLGRLAAVLGCKIPDLMSPSQAVSA